MGSIALPGTEGGVDVYPADSRPLDYPKYADRLKDFGTAIRAGETAMVTKIRVKSKHVEFQLDGGGYGHHGGRDPLAHPGEAGLVPPVWGPPQ
ncbi:MAG: hypothetical protein H0T68_08600 [Gemmatimonadales bacterium]|nr:hypothetical protein [Gemmatimonadales bacterium]